MKPLRYLLVILVLGMAVWLGDRLGSNHSWWVFDVPPPEKKRHPVRLPRTDLDLPLLGNELERTVGMLPWGQSANTSGPAESAEVSAGAQDSVEPLPNSPESNVSLAAAADRPPGPLAIIHAKRILRYQGGRPAPAELERLRAAMIEVGQMWDRPVLIFDADGIAIGYIPLIPYEDEKHDITQIVLREMNRRIAAR